MTCTICAISATTLRRVEIVGLRFHDLCREFACRLLESGDVRDFLGHANITTTSRYLASTPVRLEQRSPAWKAAAFAHHSHKRKNRIKMPILTAPLTHRIDLS